LTKLPRGKQVFSLTRNLAAYQGAFSREKEEYLSIEGDVHMLTMEIDSNCTIEEVVVAARDRGGPITEYFQEPASPPVWTDKCADEHISAFTKPLKDCRYQHVLPALK
jgi:hypothetical protein